MNFLINLLKKRNSNNIGIATFGDLVTTPKKEDFNDIDLLKVDEFKEVYSRLLSKSGTLTSIEIHIDSLQEEINMNLDLLMRISFNEEIEIHTDNEKRIKSIISFSKLELYLHKIVELENEIKLRIIALDELKKELIKYTKIRYFINRKNCVSDEINNLIGLLCILNNQKNAIYNKVNACSIEYKTIISNNNELKNEDADFLTNRYQKLLEYATVLLDNKEIEYANSFSNITIRIAALERELEIYTYTHCKDIKKMRLTLFKYNQFLEYSSLGSSKPDEFTENDLKNLEIKFRVFDEFGKNIVTIEDLYDLYQFKFDYKTIDIFYYNNGPFDDDKKRDFTEYSIYGNIILEMIEDLKLDKDGIISKKFAQKSKDIIKIIDDILTNPDGEKYDTNYILSNNLVLSFLIATHDDLLNMFFNKKKVPTPYLFKKIVQHVIVFDDELTLSNFFRFYQTIIKCNLKTSDYYKMATFNFYGHNWYYPTDLEKKLSKLQKINSFIAKKEINDENSKNYYMPEGIKQCSNPFVKRVMPDLVDDISIKNFYTSKSLVKLSTYALSNIKMSVLIFNEGLEEINVNYPIEGFSDHRPLDVINLVLPSTLKIIDFRGNNPLHDLWGFDLNKLKEIHFTNFKDNFILKNRDYLKTIFSKIITINEGYPYFKCSIEHLVLWDSLYRNVSAYFHHRTFGFIDDYIVITKKDIDEIIEEIITNNYKNISDLMLRFPDDEFLNLIVDKFIEKVLQRTDMVFNNNEKNELEKVLKKDINN